MKTVLLGGTGLIGNLVAEHAFGLTLLSRRPVPHLEGRHVIQVHQDILHLPFPDQCDQVICCLGSTLKKAGSKDAFIEQDFLLPRTLLDRARKQGAKRLLLVSALGASETSGVFYNRVKGELEATVKAMGWRQVRIYQPSLLLGNRPSDPRPLEAMSQNLGRLIAPVIPYKWRPIPAVQVARRIIKDADSPIIQGVQVLSGKSLWGVDGA